MLLTRTNVLTASSVKVLSGGDSDYPISNMLSRDFSLEYTGTGNEDLIISFSNQVDYMAFSGDYFGKCSSIRFLWDLMGQDRLITSDGFVLKESHSETYHEDLTVIEYTDITTHRDLNTSAGEQLRDSQGLTLGETTVTTTSANVNLVDSDYNQLRTSYTVADQHDTLIAGRTYSDAVTPTSNAVFARKMRSDAGAVNTRMQFAGTSDQITISYLAGGAVIEVPNGGEQAGYSRLWSAPSVKSRTQTTNGMPTETILQTIGQKGTLTIANMGTEYAKNTWSPFQVNAMKQGFFVLENEDEPQESYYCYGVKPAPVKAHSQTRELQTASISFDAWTGRGVY